MKFLDVAKVYAASGAGGNGCREHRAGERSGCPSGSVGNVARATQKEVP